MKQSACGRAIRQFYRTTTLHGFKYLCSKYYSDRVGWVVCCCASACCAGVLCAVLWARFMQVPALLTLNELRLRHTTVRMPLVAVCPTAEIVANAFLATTKISIDGIERLPPILGSVLRRKRAAQEQLELLDAILERGNLSLQQFLFKYTPSCRSIIRTCRWQSRTLPCFDLFQKELTHWGVCCVIRPTKIHIPATVITQLEITRRLNLGIQCSNESSLGACEFYTKYENEEWNQPSLLTPGLNYFAQLTFASMFNLEAHNLVSTTCSSSYSRSHCLLQCTEYFCGCLDPLRYWPTKEKNPTYCSVTQLNCLRSIVDNSSCLCLPPCKKMSTYMALESSPMIELNYTYDKIYYGLNKTNAVTLSIQLRIISSRHFNASPTETWITLLSSLGGVFNMFLGVGLFSALEVLFLVVVKLPIAVSRHNEIELPPIARH